MGKIYYNGVDYSTPTSSGVAGVKGSAESAYRTGNVNITPENIGLGNVNNTADNEKEVKYAENANNADCLNNVDGGHEVEIGYKNPVTDYTKINFFAAFTSDSDEIIIRPVDDALVIEYFSMVTTQKVINGTLTFGNNDNYGLRTYADNYGRIGDSSKQFYEVYANKIYENKTLLSDKYAPKAVELYNPISTAFNAHITLSQNVSNFKTLEIFYVDNDGVDNSVRIRAAASAFKMSSHAYISGTWYDKFTCYSVAGTKLNFSSSHQKNQGGVVESGNYHTIYRVVGYKY